MRSRLPGIVDKKADSVVAWRLHRTAGNVVAPAMILHNNIQLDTHNCYNSATGYYTVKVPGYYSIFASEYSIDNGTTGILYFDIQINGTPWHRPLAKKDVAGTGVTASGYVVAALSVGDTISIYMQAYTAYGLNAAHSLFTGHRIGS